MELGMKKYTHMIRRRIRYVNKIFSRRDSVPQAPIWRAKKNIYHNINTVVCKRYVNVCNVHCIRRSNWNQQKMFPCHRFNLYFADFKTISKIDRMAWMSVLESQKKNMIKNSVVNLGCFWIDKIKLRSEIKLKKNIILNL